MGQACHVYTCFATRVETDQHNNDCWTVDIKSNPTLVLKTYTINGPFYKQFPGKPAAEVSYKNTLTYRSVHVLSTMRGDEWCMLTGVFLTSS